MNNKHLKRGNINFEILPVFYSVMVRYSGHGLNIKLKVHYSNHLNTGLVRFSNGPNVSVHEWSGFRMVWVHRHQNDGLPFEN